MKTMNRMNTRIMLFKVMMRRITIYLRIGCNKLRMKRETECEEDNNFFSRMNLIK
jgi:hypothetical protein